MARPRARLRQRATSPTPDVPLRCRIGSAEGQAQDARAVPHRHPKGPSPTSTPSVQPSGRPRTGRALRRPTARSTTAGLPRDRHRPAHRVRDVHRHRHRRPRRAPAAGGAAAIPCRRRRRPRWTPAAPMRSPRVLGRLDADGTSSGTGPSSRSRHPRASLDTLRARSPSAAPSRRRAHPAAAAREYADAARTWRRAVTDPVTGHLLDYGRERYLPQKLRDLVLARDLLLRSGCTRRAASRPRWITRCRSPRAGRRRPTAAGSACTTTRLKTAGLAHIEESAADGSAVWVRLRSTDADRTQTLPPRPRTIHRRHGSQPIPHPKGAVAADGSCGDRRNRGRGFKPPRARRPRRTRLLTSLRRHGRDSAAPCAIIDACAPDYFPRCPDGRQRRSIPQA